MGLRAELPPGSRLERGQEGLKKGRPGLGKMQPCSVTFGKNLLPTAACVNDALGAGVENGGTGEILHG